MFNQAFVCFEHWMMAVHVVSCPPFGYRIFSRVHATLEVTVSVGRSVCPTLLFFRKVAYRVACARLMAIGLVVKETKIQYLS